MVKSGPKDTLINEWFPISEVGIESVRERGASSALPPIYFLHVWFARRPLTTSRAAILASILPQGIERKMFFKLMGIPYDADIVNASRKLKEAKAQNQKLDKNPFVWKRAFTHVLSEEEISQLNQQVTSFWGRNDIVILDPMAGGGSIPYEAIRLGLPVVCGDLNPVAFAILKATVEYPSKFRNKLLPAIEKFSLRIHDEAKKDLSEFFPKEEREKVFAYLWSRTIRCNNCGLIIPMSPNWWIARTDELKLAARVMVPEQGNKCIFELIENPQKKGYDPDDGTDIGKEARCPRCKKINDGEYVKKEARAGRMGHQLYAVCSKRPGAGKKMKWYFRAPTEEESAISDVVGIKLKSRLIEWERKGFVPTEDIPKQGFDTRPVQYGMPHWSDLFSPRQLLTHLTYIEKFDNGKRELLGGLKKGTDEYEFAKAVITYAAITFDACVDYNCLLSLWHPTRLSIAHVMGLQAFPFKTSYAEWDNSEMLWPWALSKTLDAYKELVKLLPETCGVPEVYQGDASDIPLEAKGADCIVVDPPYHDNVMYGEVMNFFYVWLKRMLGDVFPESFKKELIDTNEEAVANTSSFSEAGRGKAKELAERHYEAKMEACFREMNRVLRDDGVMTVMFTHRKAEAWASLAKSLINAGFTFSGSWPVLTEPGDKFGKRDKGVLKATVLLACRKRIGEKRGLWEEIRKELYEEAEYKVRKHSDIGIHSTDLLVSVYGPVLGKFADYSLVKDVTGELKNPSDALTIVAEVVNRFLTADIPSADIETLAYMNLIRDFPGMEAETDIARLATVFGGNIGIDALDIRNGSGLLQKKGGIVKILGSRQRLENASINPSKPETIRSLIDAVHVGLVIYERTGIQSVRKMLQEAGRDTSDSGFVDVLRAISQLGTNGSASDSLKGDARTAEALLGALGHQPEVTGRKGEKISDYT